jgi:NAD/NADP transhydrogenase alpha subunit
MVGIGGFFVMGGGYLPETFPQALGAASVLLAFVNISGGFVITKRMLDMFKRRSPLGFQHTESDNCQALLIRQSTHGFMQSQLQYLVVVSSWLPQLARLDWSKLVIW